MSQWAGVIVKRVRNWCPLALRQPKVRYCCVTGMLLLRYCCVTVALLVRYWYVTGTLLVRNRHVTDTLLVRYWYVTSKLLVRFWYVTGMLLVRNRHVTSKLLVRHRVMASVRAVWRSTASGEGGGGFLCMTQQVLVPYSYQLFTFIIINIALFYILLISYRAALIYTTISLLQRYSYESFTVLSMAQWEQLSWLHLHIAYCTGDLGLVEFSYIRVVIYEVN